jgi:acetyl esterase/lipase
MTLATDPRADPRMVAEMGPIGLAGPPVELPVTVESSLDELLEFVAATEEGFGAVFAALLDGLPPVEGVRSETVVIQGVDGNDISLYVHRPADQIGPVPGILHLHGGGMVSGAASNAEYVRWRDELAATGLVVLGVEFRNGAGKLGPYPYPAGLNDCMSGLAWANEHRSDLGIGKLIVSGESGGGNLTLAVTLKAKQEGRLGQIDGAYAMCPYISNAWATLPPELPSLRENDDYFIGCRLMTVLAKVYDPEGGHASDSTCWPLQASVAELAGMPPHVISVNELDPLRDEGLAYYRKLVAAAVPTYSRTVNGTCHGGDGIFRRTMPEVYAATIRDIKGFASSL